MASCVNLGVIGVGRFGRNYVKTALGSPHGKVLAVCAQSKESLNATKTLIPRDTSLAYETDYKKILRNDEIDAVIIATPGSTHYSLIKQALEAKKHVLSEKPMAFRASQAADLFALARKQKKILMQSSIHCFNPGIVQLKKDIESGILGKINFINYLHTGNGPVRKDMGVIWDFFPHLVSIIQFILKDKIASVSCSGASYVKKRIEDYAVIDIALQNNTKVHGFASWLYPSKNLTIAVSARKTYALFDDYAIDEKLRYYEPDIKGKENRFVAPLFPSQKPLTLQLDHFLDCVHTNRLPTIGGTSVVEQIRILESAQRSVERNGALIKV